MSHTPSGVAPHLNNMAPIWQQSYTFITRVIKSEPLSVQKSLYAQLIICEWRQEVQCDACLQLILFLLLNAHTHLATVQKNRARSRDASRSSTSYFHAFMLWRISTFLYEHCYTLFNAFSEREFLYNICSQNACVPLYIDPHLMLTFTSMLCCQTYTLHSFPMLPHFWPKKQLPLLIEWHRYQDMKQSHGHELKKL
jgi:hypothetical protein